MIFYQVIQINKLFVMHLINLINLNFRRLCSVKLSILKINYVVEMESLRRFISLEMSCINFESGR